MELEKVYGVGFIEWLYKSLSGRFLWPIICGKWMSQLYGSLQNLESSKKKIPQFLKDFNIDLTDFLPEEGHGESDPYSTFNHFFIRKFRPGKREFVQDKSMLAAFAEARYFGYSTIRDDDVIPVKGTFLNAPKLLESEKWSHVFSGGPLLLARLCPVDYHRFHFPDDGKVLDEYRIHGEFHSVNPIALKEKQDIFIANERHVTIFETEHFGKLAYVEVGATCVGKIVQTHKELTFKRGDEKGYFLFGGSTVIVIGEPGRWRPSADILEHTQKGIETYLHLGTAVGELINSK